MIRYLKVHCLIAFFFLAAFGGLARESVKIEFDDDIYTELSKESFVVPAEGILLVEVAEGKLLVESWDKEVIDLEVRKELDASDESQAKRAFAGFQINTKKEGNRFYITSASGFGWSDLHSIVLSIKVPVRYSVDLKTGGGMVKTGELEGDVKITSGGGGIYVGMVRNGSVEAKTSGGNIRIQKIVSGDGKVETSGGNIVIGDVSGSLSAETSGGNIETGFVGASVRALTAGGGILVNGSGGDVEVETKGGKIVVGQTKGHISARTYGGSIVIDEAGGEVNATTSGGNIRLNGALGPVRLETSGGNISIKRAFGFVNAETHGGSIKAELREAVKTEQDQCKLELRGAVLTSHGGELEISVGDRSQATFDITLSLAKSQLHRYSIHSEFPLDINKKKAGLFNKWKITGTGSINGGGGLIKASTVGSNVYINKLNP